MRPLIPLLTLLAFAGCVFSPEGEDEERDRARDAWPGEPDRPLPADASLDDILRYAHLSHAGLKERWWAWRAALEQIPQDAAQPGVPALTYEQMFEQGATSWSQATFGLVNDPMTNLVWPGRLRAAGRRALENARAAGFRFEAARRDIRSRTAMAWFDYALLAESIRTREGETAILETALGLSEAGLRAGTVSHRDVLKARTERDLARNRLEADRSGIPGRRAAINALLNRDPFEPLDPPSSFPPARSISMTDEEVLAHLARFNPDLEALAREARGRKEAVTVMRMKYVPELGLGFSADAGGLARSLMGMLTAPFVRNSAIGAAIAQAKAELEMTRALRRQTEHDLKARAVLLLYDFRNTDREAALYETSILPQADQIVEILEVAYASDRATAIDLLEGRRMRLEVGLMRAELRTEREKLLAELEALSTIGDR